MVKRDDIARSFRDTRTNPHVVSYAPTETTISFKIPSLNIPKYFFFGGIFLLLLFGLAYVFKFSAFASYVIDWTKGGITKVIVPESVNTPRQYIETPIPATTSTHFPSVLQYGYTVGFDVNISNPTPVQGMYRVIFYNGAQTKNTKLSASDLTQANNVGTALSFITGSKNSGIDGTSLTSIQNALNATFSNLCVYMAPDTNDLYLTYYVGHFARTTDGSNVESSNGWNISDVIIKNVPVNMPFRLTLMVDGQFIETYMNGELVSVTKTIIPGQTSNLHSYNSSYNYNFFGPPDSIYYAGTKVANLQYWGEILPPASIRVFSSAPGPASIFSSL